MKAAVLLFQHQGAIIAITKAAQGVIEKRKIVQFKLIECVEQGFVNFHPAFYSATVLEEQIEARVSGVDSSGIYLVGTVLGRRSFIPAPRRNYSNNQGGSRR